MLLNEKITIIRKMNNLTQEGFAEELGVSRQAVSKWESGNAIPDVQLLLRIADLLEEHAENEFAIEAYLGKICDVSMNSFRYSVIRNVQILGISGNMVCFKKNKRYGYFNKDKSLGILVKGEKEFQEKNEIICGKCTVYVNKGTYFGGSTYAFSSIERVYNEGIEIHTGKFVTNVEFKDVSVIMMSDKVG